MSVVIRFWFRVRGSLLLSAIAFLFAVPPAHAVPSFARQTGLPCAGCHVGAFGPQLNDYGRHFKLNGYVWGDEKVTVPAISAMLLTSFTHTASGQPGGAAPGFGDNNDVSLDQASLFYGGRIYGKLGAMIQGTYDGIAKQFTIDNIDIRLANQGFIGDQMFVYGLSINNNPTVQDAWNTTTAWGLPFVSSALAPSPAAATLIEGNFAQQVIGVSAYGLWNDLVLAETGVYTTLAAGTQSALGVDPSGENQIHGAAPYWRLVVQKSWKHIYAAVGTFGLDASVFPGRDTSAGTDHYRDLGFDLTLQDDIGAKHTVLAQANYIHETQDLKASLALGNTANPSNELNTARVTASYFYDQTYGLIAGYFDAWGTKDAGLFAPNQIGGSASASPNSNGYLFEANYTPFGKDGSWHAPWINVRLGLQYIVYTEFNGGRTNYDGFGRNAKGNDTLYGYVWFAF
ncbi:MAG: cytochrome C [Rhodospirillaceae bacterium]|nr:MAG: cytochrome C [Rhodospirillaceae bacterium]